MVTVLEPTTEPQEPSPHRLRAFASRPGPIASAGLFTVIVGALFGAGWLSVHRTYWEGQWECSASLGLSTIERHSLTLVAATAAVVATVAIFQIARSTPPRARAVTTFWLASISLWLTLALMLFGMGVSVNACARGLPL